MRSQPGPGTAGAPVWVTHTPTAHPLSDGGHDSSPSSCSSSPSSSCSTTTPPPTTKGSLRDRLTALLPPSWSTRKHTTESNGSNGGSSIPGVQLLPNGTRVSPPGSPVLELGKWDQPSWSDQCDPCDQQGSLLSGVPPAQYYAEKVEVYNMRYSYLKSWPGLLRLLAGLQLLFGGMVFACVIAYVQKDSEWSNTYGGYNNAGPGAAGYAYGGPMTPFVLAVAGVSWMLTLGLLVAGMTMYYRTILLDAPWWPLTEAFINVALFMLYMAAGIVYLNDLNRGGLCSMAVGVNPILASLCRVDGGQMAGAAFVFINMSLYLGSFLVCLKMWRHEAARRERLCPGSVSIQLTPDKTKPISMRRETEEFVTKDPVHRRVGRPDDVTASSSSSDVKIIPDYILKYPEIQSVEARETYRAVFNDQYQEYKDLHGDIRETLSRFSQMEAMMKHLPRRGNNPEEQQRIRNILQKFNQKKKDSAFLEKKQRCDYLKSKLSHIKRQIHTFDQETQ